MLAAAGTCDQLKRSVGSDVIVASVSDARRAQRALVGLTPAMQTEAYEGELAISTTDGAGQISQIALALNRAGVTVTSLTLPTARLITYSCTLPVRECTTRPTTTQVNLPLRFPVERRCGRRVVAKRAGLWRDLFYLSGRGVRSVTRDFEMLVTALIVPAFFLGHQRRCAARPD